MLCFDGFLFTLTNLYCGELSLSCSLGEPAAGRIMSCNWWTLPLRAFGGCWDCRDYRLRFEASFLLLLTLLMLYGLELTETSGEARPGELFLIEGKFRAFICLVSLLELSTDELIKFRP